MAEQTFVRAAGNRPVSDGLLRPLRRIVRRDPSMAVPPRDPEGGESLTVHEQETLLTELMQSVDENAHRRGAAEARGLAEVVRTERWQMEQSNGALSLALIDVRADETVVLAYELLAQLLEGIGAVKAEEAELAARAEEEVDNG